MVIKTAFARSPKKWLENEMQDYPGGTWIVLEGRTKNNVNLITIGYKYNTKKVMIFIMTKGA